MSTSTTQIFKCTFCSKTFKNAQNLQKHHKTAKYCLEIRGEMINEHKCESCEKIFASSNILNRHQQTCSKYLNFELRKSFQQQVDTLLKKLNDAELMIQQEKLTNRNIIEGLNQTVKEKDALIFNLKCELNNKESFIKGVYSAKPQHIHISNTATNNTNNNNGVIYNNSKVAALPIDNIQPFTTELVENNLHLYTLEEFKRKGPGVIDFIKKLVVKDVGEGTASDTGGGGTIENGEELSDDSQEDLLQSQSCHREINYACTDISRDKFHRLKDIQTWEKDVGANFLKSIMRILGSYSYKHYNSILATMSKSSSTYDEFGIETAQDISNFYYGLTGNGKEHKKLFLAIKNGVSDFTVL